MRVVTCHKYKPNNAVNFVPQRGTCRCCVLVIIRHAALTKRFILIIRCTVCVTAVHDAENSGARTAR
jgi:hypothetical protein